MTAQPGTKFRFSKECMALQFIKLTSLSAVCLVLLSVFFSHAAITQSRHELSPAEKRGRQIYLKGEDASRGEIKVSLGSTDLEAPGSTFACANCHGRRGEGTKEGGLQPPPIDWETLSRQHVSALTGRERPPYNERMLARAIEFGVDPVGAGLHAGMPHYEMSAAQMADLIAYLRRIGTDVDADPGISEESIKVGAALPLTGSLAPIGEDIKATLEASFAEINESGGIYGRRFELVVEDSRGEAAQTLEATRRLIEQDGVFALVGSFETGDSAALHELIRSSEIPLVGPVTLSPRLTLPPNPFVFYLLPTFNDQARVLVDFAQAKAGEKPARFGVIYLANDFNNDALAGLKAQAKIYSTEIVAEYSYRAGNFSPAAAQAVMSSRKATHIFFFGGADEIKTFAREMERTGSDASLLSSVVMVGREAFNLPAGVAAQTFLSYPSAVPGQDDFAEFINQMRRGKVSLRSPAFQSVAYAAVRVFLESAKLSGRNLNRSTLISSLEGLKDFRTGVVPPVSFGPNRRVGSVGSYVVGINLKDKSYLPLSDRLTPKEKP